MPPFRHGGVFIVTHSCDHQKNNRREEEGGRKEERKGAMLDERAEKTNVSKRKKKQTGTEELVDGISGRKLSFFTCEMKFSR